MSEDNSKDAPRIKRLVRLTLVSAFLLAFLWPLGSFFIWIFLGTTSSLIFLIFYYSPRSQSSDEKKYSKSHRAKPPTREGSIADSKKNLKRIVLFGVISAFSLLSILMVIGFIWGDETTNARVMNEEDRAALKANPNDLDALTNMGNHFYSENEYDSALSYYDKVLSIDPKNSSGTYNKSLVYYQKKDYTQSIEWSKKAVGIDPENTDAIIITGDSYYALENFNEAITWYQKAYLQGARGKELLYLMGYIYDKRNEQPEAIRFYKETLQQDSSYLDIYDRLIELEPTQAKRYQKMAEKWR